MEEVDGQLLVGRPAKAVFLPTAAAQEGADRLDYWVRLGTAHFERLGAKPVPLLVRDRRDADDLDLADHVAGAGVVYLSGGNPGYLADTLRGTAVLQAILDAWRAGAALAGCSAGASALTAWADDVLNGAVRPGLRVVPKVAVLSHFDRIEEWWPGLVDRWLRFLEPGQVLLGIDEETALVGGPDLWRVHGRGRAWFIDAQGGRHGYPSVAELDVRLQAG
jgi:cyanophycinase